MYGPKDNPPNQLQVYLLDCFVEECSEMIKAAQKIKRFGWDSFHPNDPDKTRNGELLTREIADFNATYQLLQENSESISWPSPNRASAHKREIYRQLEAQRLLEEE